MTPCVVDSTARVSPLCEIEESIRATRVVVGAHVVLDSFVKIKPAGGSGDVDTGPRTIINSGCVFYTGNGISIGEDVALAANCTLAPVNHEYHSRHKIIHEQRFGLSKGGILIEGDIWIGAGCVLLDESIPRRGCVIGAISLVRGEIFAYSVKVGNPLLQIRWRD